MFFLVIGLLVAVIILVLVLVKFLYELTKTINNVNKVIDDNKRNIDVTMLELSQNLEETTKFLRTLNLKEREIRETIDNVETITKDISEVTTTVANVVIKGNEILETTTDALANFNKINNIFNKDKKGDSDAN